MYTPLVIPELPECLAIQGWQVSDHSHIPGWWFRELCIHNMLHRDLLTYNYHSKSEWEIELWRSRQCHKFASLDPEDVAVWYTTGLLTGEWE